MRKELTLPVVVGLALYLLFSPTVSKAASEQAEADQTVILRNIEFNPSRIKVSVGDRVKFINRDPFLHDILIVRAANPNIVIVPTTLIPAGQSVTVTIEEEGLFTLYCTIHGGMKGKVSTTGSFELSEGERK